ncbi:hypothetical protein BOW53_12250 [Solemya pervernicosa gill symbiont]|uniref:Uncharacterized protein n=3 Tax=Gammaproteobacteria incertae sedis TaxID=118884 RepID=A0A1T2L2S0_9GAMM|nr:hypothetical protein [Solemya pervernicosa gill symbiont]OOZ39320.1 hypothetical protein BOW53_12250 [Solemya pervernicosa gill symbiont]QKQ28134.1 hypothetical protein HUE57_03660 [Candidatus Reidiella endopervernicosa]
MTDAQEQWCFGCVFYPQNLPRFAYGDEDWVELQQMACAYECVPGEVDCLSFRKTSCSVVDLQPVAK